MRWIPVLVLASVMAAISLLACCWPATASDCGAPQRRGVVVATPVVKRVVVAEATPLVVAPAVVAVPVATFVPVPLYAASYIPPPAPIIAPAPAVPAATAESRAVLDALQRISQRLDALERRGEPAVSPPPGPRPADPFNPGSAPGSITSPASRPADVLALFSGRCASCHEAKVAADKGGDFTLLQGGALARLDDRSVRKVFALVYSGKMPKGAPRLTDEEVAVVAAWVEGMK